MSGPADARRFVDDYYRDWNTLDAETMAAKYTLDCVMEDPLLPVPARGRDAIREYYAEQFGRLVEPAYAPLDFASHGDRVYIRWEYSFRLDAERVVYRGVSVKFLADGLIAADLAYWAPEHPAERRPLGS